MIIVIICFLSINLFSQEESIENNCTQELEKKCSEADGNYQCIMADPFNEKKKFSAECFPQFKSDLENGKYSHPCLDEVKTACPTQDKGCIKAKKASFSSDCQEFINEEGIPQAPRQQELNKVVEDCKAETITSCEPFLIDHHFALNQGRAKEGEKNLKEYIECMKAVYRKPKDPTCQDSLKEYTNSVSKDLPSKSKGVQEIK